MKKIIFGIVALLIATFITFSFTKSNVESMDNEMAPTTFYAIKNPPNSPQPFHWTDDVSEILENELECESLLGASCSVLATTKPADGQMPLGQSPTNKAYQ